MWESHPKFIEFLTDLLSVSDKWIFNKARDLEPAFYATCPFLGSSLCALPSTCGSQIRDIAMSFAVGESDFMQCRAARVNLQSYLQSDT